jgi:alpha-ketoglutarate-dependent taurine dioxygenase
MLNKPNSSAIKLQELPPQTRSRLKAIMRREKAPVTKSGAIVRRSDAAPAPLSFAQQRLWFLDQYEPDRPLDSIPLTLKLFGTLDVVALQRALSELVRRHEALRTRFTLVGEEPMQLIDAPVEFALPLIDFSGVPKALAGAEVCRFANTEASQSFDLKNGPLIRAKLLRLAAREHVLILNVHHIVSDGWSMGVIFREIAALYNAYSSRLSSPLAELPIQYVDYAIWQRDWLRGQMLERQLAYWKKQLSGAPELLDLPTDHPRPSVFTHAGGRRPLTVPSALTRALVEVSRSEGATLFMTLLAVYQTLLAQLSGQEEVLVGAPIGGRNRVETEALIGVFINTLVLRADFSANPSFRQLLRQVRETALAAYANQDLPFDLLVKQLRPKRCADRTLLVQASFNWQDVQISELAGLELRPMDAGAHLKNDDGPQPLRVFQTNKQTSRFDLTLFMWPQGEELRGDFEYNIHLFEAKTIEEWVAHYGILLESIVANPEVRITDLRSLPKRHRRRESVSSNPEPKGRALAQDQTARRNKFIATKPKAVSTAGLVKTAYLPGAALPMMIEPAIEDVDLIEWAKVNHRSLDAELLQHGALLFRGFRLKNAAHFERFIRGISSELIEYSYRSTPRTKVEGRIYTSTEYPPEQSIPLHNEMSYSRSWPMKIWFFSVQQATQGGETPIADSRKVYSRLDPRIRQRFKGRKVMYVRNYGSGLDLSWQDVFQTTDKAELEAFCARASMTLEWVKGDRLRTRQVCQAVAEHPRTKERVWFNQAHLFHVSSLHPEAREGLLAQFDEADLPRNAYYGDGSPIEDSILDEIRGVYAELETAFLWHESDVLMLDNMLVAHGRRPFSGPRKVLVGMAEASGMDGEAIA